jgi:hypothetical protein
VLLHQQPLLRPLQLLLLPLLPLLLHLQILQAQAQLLLLQVLPAQQHQLHLR